MLTGYNETFRQFTNPGGKSMTDRGSESIVLGDVGEDEARGELAVIYGEIRHYKGVPYVSSLQRQFASLPGVLEWAWGALRPAFISGRLPEAAWRIARDLDVCQLPPFPAGAAMLPADDIAVLRTICDSFSRASPVNLLFAGCLARLLSGERPGGSAAAMAPSWTPPAPVPDLPAMVDPASAPDAVRDALGAFGRDEGEQAFIPGNYRMFAHWPDLIVHLAEALPPLLESAEAVRVMEGMAAAMRIEAGRIVAELPPPPDGHAPPEGRVLDLVRGALAKYARTSPEMMLVHPAISAALPGPAGPD